MKNPLNDLTEEERRLFFGKDDPRFDVLENPQQLTWSTRAEMEQQTADWNKRKLEHPAKLAQAREAALVADADAAKWVGDPYPQRDIEAAKQGNREAAERVFAEFIATVDAHRTKGGEYHKLQCGQHIHLNPLLGDYLADLFRELLNKNATAGLTLRLESRGKLGRPGKVATEEKHLRLGCKVVQRYLEIISGDLPKKSRFKSARGEYNLPAYSPFDNKPNIHLDRAIQEVAEAEKVMLETLAKYYTQWRELMKTLSSAGRI